MKRTMFVLLVLLMTISAVFAAPVSGTEAPGSEGKSTTLNVVLDLSGELSWEVGFSSTQVSTSNGTITGKNTLSNDYTGLESSDKKVYTSPESDNLYVYWIFKVPAASTANEYTLTLGADSGLTATDNGAAIPFKTEWTSAGNNSASASIGSTDSTADYSAKVVYNGTPSGTVVGSTPLKITTGDVSLYEAGVYKATYTLTLTSNS